MQQKSSLRTVLVTGAAGFIGRHLLEVFCRFHPEVKLVAIDRRPKPSWLEVAFHRLELSQEHREILGEIIDRYGIDAVVHCAGSSSPDVEALRRDHLESALSLLQTISSSRPGLIFCHIGSSAEYRPLPRPEKTREDTPTEPVSEYGRVKLEVTRKVLEYSRRGAVQGYVMRLFNPIGVGMPKTQLVGRLCRMLERPSEHPLIVGNLDTCRDYGDVRDMARAVASSLFLADRLAGRVINIGSGCAHSTRELVTGLLGHLPWPVILEESENQGSFRSPAVDWQEADISLAEELIGWSPKIPFPETLEHIARSCLKVSHGRSRE